MSRNLSSGGDADDSGVQKVAGRRCAEPEVFRAYEVGGVLYDVLLVCSSVELCSR
jgi:hypothetical protein